MSLPVFIFLLFLGAAVLWLLLSFAFIPLGRFCAKLWQDAKDNMSKEDQQEEIHETKE